ncbi:GNAT family N-acetyltransferase [Actinoallomurus sp. NPDC050550]|uniref:GNAT family N-acetyltransferase n=1 Tax=Actinoallomurus sp. NPDC050550 TaxID=3154937 RepID=UPI0033F85458
MKHAYDHDRIVRECSAHRPVTSGFHRPPDQNGTVTIGYGLIPSVRGQGYAAEALRGILAFAEANGVTHVKGDADLDNIASQRVMMAAGMRQTGEDDRVKYYETAWTDAATDHASTPMRRATGGSRG